MITSEKNYDENYFNKKSEKSISPLLNYIEFLKNDGIILKGKTICDFGCANGNLINLLKDDNECYGYDISSDAIKTCKNRFPLIKDNFEVVDINHNSPKVNKKFDIVFLLDVIEHFYNFEFFYKFLEDSLKSGGFLVITTPNSNAFTRYILPLDQFTGEIDQTHRVLFTSYTLDFFLRKCNLSKVSLSTPFSFYFKNNFITTHILGGGQIFGIYQKK